MQIKTMWLADMEILDNIKKAMNERTLAASTGKWVNSLSEALGEN